MLVRVLFKNFLSYYSGTEFNMLPNPKKKRFSNHIYDNYNIPLLKVAAIYGANGAGKSNLLKGMAILNRLVGDKNYLKIEDVYNNYRFLLDDSSNKLPISIGVEFINEGKTFYYRIDIINNKISKEELYVSSKGINEEIPVFIYTYIEDERKLQLYDKNGEEDFKYADDRTYDLLKKNPLSSIMSLHNEFPIILNSEDANIAYRWFSDKLLIVPISISKRGLIKTIDNDVDLKSYINRKITDMSLGIKSVDIKVSDLASVFADKIERDDKIREKIIDNFNSEDKSPKSFIKLKQNRPIFHIETDIMGRRVAKELIFSQKGINGYIGEMSINSQSEGTVSLLSKLPLLYKLSKEGMVIFIDEIESSLHPQLIEKFLKIFLDDNSTKGQLIFTTHEVHILDQQNLLRADEVWFAEKEYGQTSLYSLNDFKEHNTIDIAKGYLAGRYGAIPFAGSSLILDDID